MKIHTHFINFLLSLTLMVAPLSSLQTRALHTPSPEAVNGVTSTFWNDIQKSPGIAPEVAGGCSFNRLCKGTENNKRWPDEGETVTYTAHVVNKGVAASSGFHFEWLINGTVVAQGTSHRLPAGNEQTFDYSSAFLASPQTIEFRVEPRGSTRKEAFTSNNRLAIGSHDLTLSIWVEQGLYDVFNRELNLVGTHSFEDWIQRQIAIPCRS